MDQPVPDFRSLVDRRQFLSHTTAMTLTSVVGCAPATFGGGQAGGLALLDVHCHLFNLVDLPATKFITQVLLERYPEPAKSRVMNVEDRDWLEKFVGWVVSQLARKVPSAAEEAKLLSAPVASANAEPSALSEAASRDFVAERIAERLQVQNFKGDPTELRINEAIRRAARRAPPSAGLLPGARGIADQALASSTDLGTFLRWVATLRMYRHKVTQNLADEYRRQTLVPRLLAPALVDYSHWLGEWLRPDSDLPWQVEAMGWVARRASLPVHGYVAYDPLREAYFKKGLTPWGALALVRQALTKHGFLGVKLYPPMGFRPWGNAGSGDSYPDKVIESFGAGAGVEFDRALAELYQDCVNLGAPIIAHGSESWGAGHEYAKRADPTHWFPVVRNYPKLRVCLAHFGSFTDVVAGKEPPKKGYPPFEDSWEFAIGGFVRDNPGSNLFADISYLSDIFGRRGRTHAAQGIRTYIRNFDPSVRHLLFGSDWVMLGVQSKYPGYALQVHDFLKSDCALTDEQLNNVFFANPVRFLGLGQGHPTLTRLLEFYRANGLDPARLEF